MATESTLPELKQILGALIFGAARPLSVKEMRGCLIDVAEAENGEATAFAKVRESDIRAALDALRADLLSLRGGFVLHEAAGGFRLQSDAACGEWLKRLLDTGKPHRLSHPSLETLAIIAYRQPVTRSAIEAVRGVSVDHVIKTLMEMQLVRILGRSDLPGRPFQYGTTHLFLDHFGLKRLNELSEMEPMLLRDALEKKQAARAGEEPVEKKNQEQQETDDREGDNHES